MKITKKKLEGMSKENLIELVMNYDNNLKVCEENYSRLNYEIIDANKEMENIKKDVVKLMYGYEKAYDRIVKNINGRLDYLVDMDAITLQTIKSVVALKLDIEKILGEEMKASIKKKENSNE